MTMTTNKPTLEQIVAAIDSMTESDLRLLDTVMRERRDTLTRRMNAQLVVGDTVEFDRGPKRGGMCQGRVVKINLKSVVVNVGGVRWTLRGMAPKKVS